LKQLVRPVGRRVRVVYRRAKYALNAAIESRVAAVRDWSAHDAPSPRLLIFDDIFPQMLSAFRIAEYGAYLEHFRDARVYSTATAFKTVGEKRPFDEVVLDYENHYPQLRNRVFKYSWRQDMRGGLVYTVFANNAFRFIPVAERHQTPFVFTLYPGGGFLLNNFESDRRLRRVFSSRSFRKVIATQQITRDYLVEQGLCPPDRIEFIYGGVLPSRLLAHPNLEKQRFPANKRTFDICFVAHKYTPRGTDKGYDIFIEAANRLAQTCQDMRFHVVGSFGPNDIDVSAMGDRIRFYGSQYTDFFPGFYATMDIILSPNRAFGIYPGNFDGFPTGGCVEAGLCGVALVCTDPLQQNIKFQDKKEIVIVPPDAREICAEIEWFYHHPDSLYELSALGQQAYRNAFDVEAQMKPRLELLSSFLPTQP